MNNTTNESESYVGRKCLPALIYKRDPSYGYYDFYSTIIEGSIFKPTSKILEKGTELSEYHTNNFWITEYIFYEVELESYRGDLKITVKSYIDSEAPNEYDMQYEIQKIEMNGEDVTKEILEKKELRFAERVNEEKFRKLGAKDYNGNLENVEEYVKWIEDMGFGAEFYLRGNQYIFILNGKTFFPTIHFSLRKEYLDLDFGNGSLRKFAESLYSLLFH